MATIWTELRRMMSSAMGRGIPRPKANASKPRQFVSQGDLAPSHIAMDSDKPELGQTALQLYYEGLAREGYPQFPVKTEAFGPYNPSYVPLWILKMMRRDFAIKLASSVFHGPLLQESRYFLVGGDPETRAFTEAWLRPLLPKLLRTGIANARDFGFQAHEIVFDEAKPTITFNVEGGGTRQVRNAVIPRAFNDLDPEGVELFIDPKTGRFEGLETGVISGRSDQIALMDPTWVPASKIFLTTNQLEFANFRGNSWMIPAYNPWWWKNVGYMYWGRFQERLGMGVYVGRGPSGSRTTRGGIVQDCLDLITGLLMKLRSGGVISIPRELDDKGNDKWDVELMESKNQGEGFERWIMHLTISIMRALSIPDRLAVQDGAGSFAGMEVAAEQFFSTQESVAGEMFLEPLNSQVIAPVIRYNFDNKRPAPRLAGGPLNPATRKQYFELIKALHGTQIKKSKPKAGSTSKPVPKPDALAFPPKPGEPKKPGDADMPPPIPTAEPQITLAGAMDIVRMAKNIGIPIKEESEWLESQPEGTEPAPEQKLKDTTQTDEDKFGPRDPKGDRSEASLALEQERSARLTALENRAAQPPVVVNVAAAQAPVVNTPIQVMSATPAPAPAPVIQVMPAPPTPINVMPSAPTPINILPSAPTPIEVHNHNNVEAKAGEVKLEAHVTADVNLPVPKTRTATVKNSDGTTSTIKLDGGS